MTKKAMDVETGRKTLRWVLAHEPVTTFEKAARRFSERLAAKDGGLDVEVFSAADYGRRLSPSEVIDKVVSGEIQMCQTYTSSLARFDERLLALDLPYLFRDHEHAASALDGQTGRGLLGGMLPKGLRGLAFTYSGGFRVLATTGASIEGASSLRGLRVRTGETPVPEAFFRELGAEPVPAPLTRVAALAEAGSIDAAEVTYPRYWDGRQPKLLPSVVETGHSLLLTMMVINEQFFESLSGTQKESVLSAAGEAALIERATSIEEGEDVKKRCPSEGVTLSDLPKAETARWRRAGEKVTKSFEPRLGRDLIRALAA